MGEPEVRYVDLREEGAHARNFAERHGGHTQHWCNGHVMRCSCGEAVGRFMLTDAVFEPEQCKVCKEETPMTANQTATGYVVSAFRTRRDYLLGHPDYSRTVVDEPGQPPASERADALWSELLLNRPARLRFGWQIITRAPLTDPKVIRP